jgi:NhaP-type Na+/H+ or K+/H+ antiporter
MAQAAVVHPLPNSELGRLHGDKVLNRDLIVLVTFTVVVGTLVLPGLTLKPLLCALDLRNDDPVGRELHAARVQAWRAALACLADDRSQAAEALRQEIAARLAYEVDGAEGGAGDGARDEARSQASALHTCATRCASSPRGVVSVAPPRAAVGRLCVVAEEARR